MRSSRPNVTRRAPIPSVIAASVGSSTLTTTVASAGSRRSAGAPLRRDRVELAIAVELVAEEVVQQDHGRLDPAHDLRKRRLVALDDADVGARAARQSQPGWPARWRRRAPDSSRSGCGRRAARAPAGCRQACGRPSSCRWSRRRRRFPAVAVWRSCRGAGDRCARRPDPAPPCLRHVPAHGSRRR